ncbi:MAG: lamin tail domain-containing protein, partial [Elusimicrobiota bacterium]|nr:lamin tail domain-containing protein [Elusimicrobiota bacterium]
SLFLSLLYLKPLHSQQPTIIITEVLANALAYPDEYTEEFIELYNSTTYQINLSGYQILAAYYSMKYNKNYCDLTRIIPWTLKSVKNPYPVISGTTNILPGQYAVVISTTYLNTQQRYSFPQNTLILTTTHYTLIGKYGIGNTDAITLYGSGGTTLNDVISTFGNPVNSATLKDRIPSSADFPYKTGRGVSWERINYGVDSFYDVDVATNWAQSRALRGCTPGARNSVVPTDISKIIKTEKILNVSGSPFYPHRGDHPTKTSAKISYCVPSNTTITLRIFDIKGNLILTPINQESTLSVLHNPEAGLYCFEESDYWKGTYYWNGKNESGEIVPIGVYICYIEAVQSDKGRVHKGKAGVVVGRKLD